MLSTEETMAVLAFERQNLFSATTLTLQVILQLTRLETKLSSQP
jgi:hypothetical protein